MWLHLEYYNIPILKIMIYITRLNNTRLVINCDLIKFIESTPDTVITLTSGEKMMVKETPDELIGETIAFRKKNFEHGPPNKSQSN